jgi:hypothetical protein
MYQYLEVLLAFQYTNDLVLYLRMLCRTICHHKAGSFDSQLAVLHTNQAETEKWKSSLSLKRSLSLAASGTTETIVTAGTGAIVTVVVAVTANVNGIATGEMVCFFSCFLIRTCSHTTSIADRRRGDHHDDDRVSENLSSFHPPSATRKIKTTQLMSIPCFAAPTPRPYPLALTLSFP